MGIVAQQRNTGCVYAAWQCSLKTNSSMQPSRWLPQPARGSAERKSVGPPPPLLRHLPRRANSFDSAFVKPGSASATIPGHVHASQTFLRTSAARVHGLFGETKAPGKVARLMNSRSTRTLLEPDQGARDSS